MFDSMEMAVAWAASVLGTRACTYLPADPPDELCVVERVGGELDYPHDSPEFAFQVWAKAEKAAKDGACLVAVAAKTAPPADGHVNSVGVPTVYSYGREDGGWFVWQATVPMEVNLLD